MTKRFLLAVMGFVLLTMPSGSIAQENSRTSPADPIRSALCRQWIWQSGWFDKQPLVLLLPDSAKHNDRTTYSAVEFHGDRTFSHALHLQKGIGACGNGMLMLDQAAWSLTGDTLELYVKGGHLAEDRFEYRVRYKVVRLTAARWELQQVQTLSAARTRYN